VHQRLGDGSGLISLVLLLGQLNLKDLPQSYVTRLGNRVRILFTGLAKALERYELDEIDRDYI